MDKLENLLGGIRVQERICVLFAVRGPFYKRARDDKKI